jgi:hypothetical protein
MSHNACIMQIMDLAEAGDLVRAVLPRLPLRTAMRFNGRYCCWLDCGQ